MHTVPRRALLCSPAALGLVAIGASLGLVSRRPAASDGGVMQHSSSTFERVDAPVCHCALCMARVAQGLPRVHAYQVEDVLRTAQG
jgi:hypothetical protein